MENSKEDSIKKALISLQNGDPMTAKSIICATMVTNLGDSRLVTIEAYCCFWCDSFEQCSAITNPYEKGDHLLVDWKAFIDYLKNHNTPDEEAVNAIQRGVFSIALECYKKTLENTKASYKAEILRKIGICYKKIGDYEKAMNCLIDSNKHKPFQAEILAELADCHALCGNDKNAKALFREAFYLDSKKVELFFLDSELIRSLIAETEKKGFKGEELNAWIPVYGVIYGVFDIKREMEAKDISKLRQDIYALEVKSKNPSNDTQTFVPTLIYKYFWLIDYCQMYNDNTDLIEQTLLKIKILDLSVYNLYKC